MRRSSPVQQWLDSLPNEVIPDDKQPEQTDQQANNVKTEQEIESQPDKEIVESVDEIKTLEVPSSNEPWKRKSLESGVLLVSQNCRNLNKKLQRDYSIQSEGYSPRSKNPLLRDYSLQSDASGSSGSSVLNVLGARKVDAESVLLALGFGPSEKQQKLQRIPDRFLVPSKLRGISTEKFIKDEHHAMRMHDCGVFGYRGLTGNPHVPPSTIVAKIMDCILQSEECRQEAMLKVRHSIADIRSTVGMKPMSDRYLLNRSA